MESVRRVDHGSKSTPTLQEILKVFVLLILISLCKILFVHHAEVGACIGVDDSNVNIIVVPCFQTPCALMLDLNYVVPVTCTGSLPSSATPFLVHPFTAHFWASLSMFVLPSSVSPSFSAPAPVLYPCTILLLI